MKMRSSNILEATQCPKKKTISEAFNTVPDLTPLLEKKGLQHCLDRVKNTLKKMRKKAFSVRRRNTTKTPNQR